MSDNIDYAELDKAVNEAIKNRSATANTTTKAAVKPSVQRPRGQFMDFVRTQPIHAPAPVVKPIAKTAPRPAVRPVANPTMRPTAHKITTAPRPAIATRSAKANAAQASRPVARPSVAAQIQQRQQKAATSTAPKPAAKPVAKPVAKAAPVKKAETPKKSDTPNANNYSLGVRSPFMTDTKVEKRPLGTNIPETSTTALRSTKNVYSSKSPSKASAAKKKHMVTEAPKKHSGWLWTLIVIGVIAAGGGLGYLAYILVFAN